MVIFRAKNKKTATSIKVYEKYFNEAQVCPQSLSPVCARVYLVGGVLATARLAAAILPRLSLVEAGAIVQAVWCCWHGEILD